MRSSVQLCSALVALAGTALACSQNGPGAGPSGVQVVRSAVQSVVDVDVHDTGGTPQAGVPVQAQDPGGGTVIVVNTNPQGHALVSLDPGAYRFATPGLGSGFVFTSGALGSCTTPACTNATIVITALVTVTVTGGDGSPAAGQTVAADLDGNLVNVASTDDSGQAMLSVDPGTYTFSTTWGGLTFQSATCTVPGCTSTTIALTRPVDVAVLDGNGNSLPGVQIAAKNQDEAYDNFGTSNDQGHANLTVHPGTYRFVTAVGGVLYESQACAVPGCTSATVVVQAAADCTVRANGTPCDDGNLCTRADICQDGICVGSNPIVCAEDACHPSGTCEPSSGTCLNPYVAGPSCPYLPVTFIDPAEDEINSMATGINDAGAIIGSSFGADGAPAYAPSLAAYFATSALAEPGILDGGGDRLFPRDINSSGFIVANGDETPRGPLWNLTVLFKPDHTFTTPIRRITHPTAITDELAANGEPTIVGAMDVAGGPLAIWRLDGDTNDTATSPTPRFAFPPPSSPSYVDDRNQQPHRALRLDGSTTLTVPTYAPVGPELSFGLSITAWVRPTGPCPTTPAFVLHANSKFGLALTCGPGGSTALMGGVNVTGATDLSLQAPMGSLAVGQWNHVAMAWNERFVRFYVNGTLVGQVAASGVLTGWSNVLTMGEGLTADLDEVVLYGSPLSASDVARLAAGNVGGLYEPYTGAWFRHSNDETQLIAPLVATVDQGTNFAFGVNDSGDVVGTAPSGDGKQHALLYTDADGLRDLNDLLPAGSGWFLSHAMHINNQRQIVGRGDHGTAHRMFRFDLATGQIKDLGILPSPNDASQIYRLADDISQTGHIVGASYDQWPFWAYRAIVYTDTLGLTDLNTMIDPTSGWTLREALAINNGDEIVGWASNDTFTEFRGFRMKLGGEGVGACLGKDDGAACDDGQAWTEVDSCRAGTCVGAGVTCQPSAQVCLRVDGVIDNGDGQFTAVFGHDSASTTDFAPTTNEVRLDGTLVSSPQPPPPASLAPGSHPASYLPTFASGKAISWRVDNQIVTASAASPHLDKVPVGNFGSGVMIGGRLVTIQPDPYMSPPQDPTPGQEPTPGTTEFNGVLTGTLSVSPTGAATYTVPVVMPPGVAGMAPNLSLVYNSQGGNGIAGQGWEMSGLSMITRCPRTRIQDGQARPIKMTPLVSGNDSDGVCLDGKRLLEDPNNPLNYYTDIKDFSTISRSSDFSSFTVVTKSGETRYYASRPDDAHSLVSFSGQPAIWAVDRVMDTWGNYYDLNYNDDGFQQNGIRVMEIDYTGHIPVGSSTADVQPFAYVRFSYETRLDVRTIRFRGNTLPKNWRLTAIDTGIITSTGTIPRGGYGLSYQSYSSALPSRLETITYCAPVQPVPPPPGLPQVKCLKSLDFGWTTPAVAPATNFWQANSPNDEYALPAQIPSPEIRQPRGLQFVDLNGDGRPELIFGRQGGLNAIWRNTGHGWSFTTWGLPTPLADQNDVPLGVRFADVDGDGYPDLIRDNAQIVCNGQDCVACNPGAPDACSGARQVSPAVWLNKVRNGGGWEYRSEFETRPTGGAACIFNVNLTATPGLCTDAAVDWNDDGRVDLVRLKQGCPSSGCSLSIDVLLNTGQGWQLLTTSFINTDIDFNNGANFRVEDLDRDGLPDLVSRTVYSYSDGHLEASESVVSNHGIDNSNGSSVLLVAAGESRIAVPGSTPGPTQTQESADIDGDGYYDVMALYRANANTVDVQRAIGFGDGVGVAYGNQTPYLSVLHDFAPNNVSPVLPGDFGWALVDANGDGLIDLVRNHELRAATLPSGAVTVEDARIGLGELLINTGKTWADIDGLSGWQVPVLPAHAVPAVPDERVVPSPTGLVNLDNGSTFVDLNGDGLPDLIQGSYSRASEFGPNGTEITDKIPSHAWLNSFSPPLITQFPNRLAKKSEVSYTVITSDDAQALASGSTYWDSSWDSPQSTDGKKPFMTPLRVVKSISQDNGVDTLTTSYRYTNLRVSTFGYGPQGFETVTATEDLTGTSTTTTFAQAYPYTGMPITVTQSNQGPLASTSTLYCTHNADRIQNPDDECFQQPEHAQPYPARSSFFLRPVALTEVSRLRSSTAGTLQGDASPPNVQTLTDYVYDDFGNPTRTTVTMSGMGEAYQKVTGNTYGTDGSLEQSRGLVTDSTVTTTKTAGSTSPDRSHHTTFRYQSFSSGPGTLGLAEKTVEPGSAEAGAEIHTAYDYDQFGNVTTTTDCAGSMPSGVCFPGATGTTDLPFRTTRVSYTVAVLPIGVAYGDGRFPTSTTNAEGHTELTAYEPLLGLVTQKIGPNGIKTCHDYDSLGNETTETARCGSSSPLITTVHRFEAPPPPPCGADVCSPPLEKVMTVTRPPGASPTWVFNDALGRTITTIAYAFDGSLVQTSTEYDNLGRVHRTSKPFSAGSAAIYWTTTIYDVLGRPGVVTQDLGLIDGAVSGGQPASNQAILRTNYSGAQVVTEHDVNGEARVRTEEKNVLGKVATVTDAAGVTSYTYDVDGNLLRTQDPLANTVGLIYDSRGRKIFTIDPDMGEWGYTYDGYGDLLTQTDAKNQMTTMTYDRLGRMTTKDDGSGSGKAQWVYDLAEGAGVGKLAAVLSARDSGLSGPCDVPHTRDVLYAETDGNRSGRSLTYTQFGDVASVSECIDGDTFLTTNTYDDSTGRQVGVTYPQVGIRAPLAVGYHYTSLGFLHYVFEESDGSVYWAAKTVNALGQVTDEYTRSGVETVSRYNPSTGWMLLRASVAHADPTTLIQNSTYRYDEGGSVRHRTRADQVTAATSDETFGYDPLDRLTSSQVTTSDGYDKTQEFTYDPLGNIGTKAGKTYTYTGCSAGARAAGPHAVCAVDGAGEYAYDGNGNMTAGSGRAITYNPFNKPVHIASAGAQTGAVDFIYGADGDRVVQSASTADGTARTVYVGMGATGKSLYERTTRGGQVEHVQFIYAGGVHGGNAFALRIVASDGSTAATKYYHFDHLGSVTAMSDERGQVVDAAHGGAATVMGYDPWGARRDPDGRPASTEFHPQVGRREFTGHETITGVGLVNMNGRVYDPVLGRFLSPDPNVQLVADLQSYNRYTYVTNNPLRYADPTGYFSSGGALRLFSGVTVSIAVSNWLQNPMHLIAVAEVGIGVAACVATDGVGCVMIGVYLAAMNAAVAISQGAPVGQTLMITGIGMGVGIATGGAASALGGSIWAAMASGAVSGVITNTISNAATGRSLGDNMFEAAAMGAVSAAIGYGLQQGAAGLLSQASASEVQGGGGSGAAQTERAATSASQSGDEGDAEGASKGHRPNGQTHFRVNGARVEATIENGRITSIDMTSYPSVDIWTTYGQGADPDAPSAYGRGTTDEDIQAGNTSLRFHEGSHAADYSRFLSDHPLPSPDVEVGMSVREFKAALAAYQVEIREYAKEMDAFSVQRTDCVGIPKAGCN